MYQAAVSKRREERGALTSAPALRASFLARMSGFSTYTRRKVLPSDTAWLRRSCGARATQGVQDVSEWNACAQAAPAQHSDSARPHVKVMRDAWTERRGTHPLVGRGGAQRGVDGQAADLVSLGQHGLDVAPAVVAEDERLGAARAALGALLQLRKHEDVGVDDDALGLKHEFLRDLGLLQKHEGNKHTSATGDGCL